MGKYSHHAAMCEHLLSLWRELRRRGIPVVVTALDIKRWLQHSDQRRGGILLEENDPVDTGERCHHLCALVLSDERPAWTLEMAHGPVAVDADHEGVAQGSGRFEVADMADM